MQKNTALRTDNDRLEGQVANARQKLESLGKGKGMLPCWTTKDGSIEYTYEVALTSEGMVVVDTNLPHRVSDRKHLAFSAVIQNKEVSSARFGHMTLPLHMSSKKKKCRFYVRVHDMMGLGDGRDLWQKRMAIVVGHFYRDFRIYKGRWPKDRK